MRAFDRRWQIELLALALLACSDRASTEPPAGTGPLVPAGISIVSGNDQVGKAGELLPAPLVVRVTDAAGNGLGNVFVLWSVISGDGAFEGRLFDPAARSASTITGPQGTVVIPFAPATIGTTTVQAIIPKTPVPPATITVEASVLVIEFWWFWGAGFLPPCGMDCDVVVPVGTPVEWVSRDAESWMVTATSAPPGVEPFRSGPLGQNERFRFVPMVAGTWAYIDLTFADIGWTPGGTITAR
jgi:hypothetical protein